MPRARGVSADLGAARNGSVAGSLAAGGLEESHWLCPIEDRRDLDSTREGMIQGFSLGSYMLLVDYTGRLFREGKATISSELAGILDRLGCSAELWSATDEEAARTTVAGSRFCQQQGEASGDGEQVRGAVPGKPPRLPWLRSDSRDDRLSTTTVSRSDREKAGRMEVEV